MRRLLNVIILMLISFIFLGCASAVQYAPLPDQSKSIDNPEKSRIYVIRPTTFGGAIGIDILDGDEHIGKTGPNTYLSWERDPGETIIYSRAENTFELPLEAKKGLQYFIEQEIHMGIWSARSSLKVLPEEEGKEKLKECKPAQAKN